MNEANAGRRLFGSSKPTKQSLSKPRRDLLEFIQSMHFGKIENLVIRSQEPVLDPLPAQVREHKFGGENGPHPKLRADDFLLKEQVVDLFQQFDTIGDGTIAVLEVKHGLPFRMLIAEPPGRSAA